MNRSNQLQLQEQEQQQRDRELIVRVFALYRLLIASALLAISMLPEFSSLLNIEPHTRFSLSTALYMATAILTGAIVFKHYATRESSAQLMLWSDILLLPLIMLSTGGFASSIGLLLALSFLLGSLSLQHGYTVRALAATTLLIIAYWFSQHFSTDANLSLKNSAILGIIYLLTGFLSSKLARHLNITEKIVLQQHLSLKNQIDVNAFIIQQLHSGALVIDHSYHIQYGNEAAWRLLGKRPQEEFTPLRAISAELEKLLQQWKTSAESLLQESARMPFNHGTAVRFCSFGSKTRGGILITLEDQKEIDNQVQQKKLASLGILTAGIAHEIRNPLSAIHQAAQLLEDSTRQNTQQMRLLEIIQTNTRRMNSQVEEILQLSRRAPNRKTLQLNQWLPPLIDEYRSASLTGNNRLTLETPDTPCSIDFDAEQLRQVLVNLITNAQQHSRPTEGELIISVSVDCPAADDFTIIDVSDNGEPIPQELIGQLFDPFFTTRHTGTGLGLYLSRELCLNNHANLEYIMLENSNTFRISGSQ
jgi:two-component system sensor histidine kinase PilS (NtrC family)